ncbi:MAG: ATP-binding cassette domain-containing protein, partial [Spirochaetaceae bacterium]
RTLFLANGAVVMRPGGVSHGLNEEHRERVEQERTHRQAEREERRLRREAQRRTEAESRSTKRLSKRTVDRHDKDAKGKIDLARISGKDRRGSDAAREMRARADEAGERRRALSLASATFISNDGAVSIDACAVRGDLITAVEAGVYPAGEPSAVQSSDTSRKAFTLEIPRLEIRPTDRIAVCGPNGAGKSTLLELIRHRLHSAGRDIFYMRQELSTSELRRVRERLDALDNTERGRVLAIITRLGSNPERVMDTSDPSPGEARKLALALASLRSPQALLLDEPTNHLDLPGIIALENTLNEYGGCLLVVSHDRQFAGRVTSQTWQIGVRECDGGRRCGSVVTCS